MVLSIQRCINAKIALLQNFIKKYCIQNCVNCDILYFVTKLKNRLKWLFIFPSFTYNYTYYIISVLLYMLIKLTIQVKDGWSFLPPIYFSMSQNPQNQPSPDLATTLKWLSPELVTPIQAAFRTLSSGVASSGRSHFWGWPVKYLVISGGGQSST